MARHPAMEIGDAGLADLPTKAVLEEVADGLVVAICIRGAADPRRETDGLRALEVASRLVLRNLPHDRGGTLVEAREDGRPHEEGLDRPVEIAHDLLRQVVMECAMCAAQRTDERAGLRARTFPEC